jgi:Uma2 family endonuclease
MAVELKRWRFTADQYEEMGRVGLLDEDDRVELIDGEIIEMAAIGFGHMIAVNRGNRRLVRLVGERAVVSVQNPIRMGERYQPQPDLVLLRPEYAEARRVPMGQHVLLVVEISDSTLEYDRRTKVPIYARGGVPQTLVADLNDRNVTSYVDPTPDGYRTTRVYRPGERIELVGLPGLSLKVSELLG